MVPLQDGSPGHRHAQTRPETPQPPARHPLARRPSGSPDRDGELPQGRADGADKRPWRSKWRTWRRPPTNGSSPIPTPRGARTLRSCWWPWPSPWASAPSSSSRSKFPPARCSRPSLASPRRTGQPAGFQDPHRLDPGPRMVRGDYPKTPKPQNPKTP